jgi:membrane fusion protein, protease secretion system
MQTNYQVGVPSRAVDVPSREVGIPAAPQAPADVGGAVRLGLIMLAIGFGGFLLWAILTPLDEGVPSPATIVVETHSVQIQHPTGGVVAQVAVREGQKVRKGDVLLQLTDVDTRAGLDSTKIQWISARALEARLLAEQAGAATINYPPELEAVRKEPMAQQQMTLQQELFATRKRALNAELSALGQQLAGTQASLVGIRQSLVAREQQLAIVEQELAGTRQMVAEGFVPRTRQNELERMAAEARASLAELRANQARLTESLTEVKLRQQQRQQEYRKEVETQLSEVRREAGAQAEKLKSASESQERTVIRAPVDGSVVGLAVQTAGGVVSPGAKLMEIVPDEAKLVLEAQIAPHLIDRIHAGMPADINLHAFVNLPQLVLPGRVVTISANSIVDQQTRTSYYLARVEVMPEGLKKLSGRELQPGMPAEVIVKTGERTMLNYLLRPLLKRFSESLKEA